LIFYVEIYNYRVVLLVDFWSPNGHFTEPIITSFDKLRHNIEQLTNHATIIQNFPQIGWLAGGIPCLSLSTRIGMDTPGTEFPLWRLIFLVLFR